MKILIPNATGLTNIGDHAILRGGLKMIEQIYPDAEVIIHSSVPESYSRQVKKKYGLKNTLYSYCAFGEVNVLVKVRRMLELIMVSFVKWMGAKKAWKYCFDTKLKKIVKDYESADIVMANGGGYLTTRSGFSQSLNILMQGVLLWWAQAATNRACVLPISFGPFEAGWHSDYIAKILRRFPVVFAREKISIEKLKQARVGHCILGCDLAFFLRSSDPVKKNKQIIVGVALRKWHSDGVQQVMESNVVKALVNFCQKYDAAVKVITHGTGEKYGDYDHLVHARMMVELKQFGVRVLDPAVPDDLDSLISAYEEIDVLIGMRMHANIMAANKGVPFVALSYEYKTEGICELLGVGHLVHPSSRVSGDDLYEDLVKCVEQREQLIEKVSSRVEQGVVDFSKKILQISKHFNQRRRDAYRIHALPSAQKVG